MVRVDVEYTGNLHCDATHGPSKSKLATDAPTDNKGRGEAFSPTDLVATALGTSVADLLEKDIRPAPREISPSLRLFAEKNQLPEGDVQMLANIRFRGDQPEDEGDWAFLYDAIRRSVRS